MGIRFFFAVAIATLAVASAGRTQELPRYDVDKDCAVNPLLVGFCVAEERKNFSLLTSLWSRASSTAKLKCLPLGEQELTGLAIRKYTLISECLVPAMRIEESRQAVLRSERNDTRQAQRRSFKEISSAVR
jgi:hypothetical protein